jgi:3-oxoacyl-[acyl-carrier-protein] synthase II
MTHSETKRRVVITGMGVIAPNGQDLDSFWTSIRDGRSAAKPVTRFDVSNLPCKVAAQIENFDYKDHHNSKHVKRLDLSSQYGIAAATQAIQDASIRLDLIDPDRVGVIEATSLSGMQSAFRGQVLYESQGYKKVSPYYLINAYCGGGSGEIALAHGIHGHAITYSSGSASGNDAIGYAFNMVQRDEVDVMVAGGSEAPLLEPLWAGFCVTKVMTKGDGPPASAMKPFDKDRDGFLLVEGAAFLVLEEYTHALTRGAKIYAEILGHGRSCEAYHSVSPHPEGIGLKRAMEKAFRQAQLDPSKIDYINAHGTATATNDLVETIAIKRFFGTHASRLMISSTKPVMGHLLAAAGAAETVVCALAIHQETVPLTVNFSTPYEGCDLDYVGNRSRPYPLRNVVNLSVGFGGKNSCLILGKVDS